jgi:hypothetical protein
MENEPPGLASSGPEHTVIQDYITKVSARSGEGSVSFGNEMCKSEIHFDNFSSGFMDYSFYPCNFVPG